MFTDGSIQNASAQDSLLSAEYAQCMEKSGGVTVEMKDCLTAEDERIEALLNATYKKTMQAMDEKQKTLLRDSQRAWLKYREGSCDTMMSVLGGTSAGLITTGWRLEMTARRVVVTRNKPVVFKKFFPSFRRLERSSISLAVSLKPSTGGETYADQIF